MNQGKDAVLSEQTEPTKPCILVNIIRNGQEAEMILQRTGPNTANPLPEDMMAALAEAGVVTGIKKDIIKEFATAPVYNRAFIVASGVKPTVGPDGSLRFLIRTEKTLRPAIREDGTADYKDLGFINVVEQGQHLVEIIPPGQGEEGFDVRGTILPGILGKKAPSPQGSGTDFSEDGRFLVAAVAGNAEVNRRIVTVKEVIQAKGVNNATGDIIFPGDIVIKGDIAAGFKVQSTKGSIIVKGSVDAAFLEAAGDIIISESVIGQDRGAVTAGGNIKCKHLQNCFIQAEGNIYADTIMYCMLECDGSVELAGKRGLLIGGRSYIAGMLTCKGIGTGSHVATKIKMCATSMAQKRELDQLHAEIAQIDVEIGKIVQLLNRFNELQGQGRLAPEHQQTIGTVKENYIALNNQRKNATERIAAIQNGQLAGGAQHSFIVCSGRVHTGVRISYGPLVYNVTDSFVSSRVLVLDGEIRAVPL